MSKYHVNNQGEPGKCKAQGEGCPFGQASDHHDSPESARVAFEKANSGKQIPIPAKKVSRREKKEKVAELNNLYNNYDPKKYEGLRFGDVVFDHVASENKNENYVKNRFPKLSKADTEDAVAARMTKDLAQWEGLSRTKPAESFENDVPMRLVPVGTEVVETDSAGNTSVVGTVGEPSPRHDVADYVGTIHMNDGTERNLEANQVLNIGKLPESIPEESSSIWERENAQALKIKKNRRVMQSSIRTGRALDNLEKQL